MLRAGRRPLQGHAHNLIQLGNMSSANLGKALKRVASVISKSKGRRQSSIERLRGMRTVVPNKRMSSVVRRANKQEGVVGGVVVSGSQGPERKKWDVNQGFASVGTSAPYINSLCNNIAQGTNVGNRIGDRIQVKAVDIEFNLTCFSGTAPTFLDVCLVWDKQPDGTIAAVTDIFVSPTTNLTFGTIANLERFQVLKREQISFDSADKLATTLKWHQSCDMAVRFASAAGWPQTNDLLIVALCPGVTGGTSGANIAYVARVSFTDE